MRYGHENLSEDPEMWTYHIYVKNPLLEKEWVFILKNYNK